MRRLKNKSRCETGGGKRSLALVFFNCKIPKIHQPKSPNVFSHSEVWAWGAISPWQPALAVATLNFSTTVYPVAAKSHYSTARRTLLTKPSISHQILKGSAALACGMASIPLVIPLFSKLSITIGHIFMCNPRITNHQALNTIAISHDTQSSKSAPNLNNYSSPNIELKNQK